MSNDIGGGIPAYLPPPDAQPPMSDSKKRLQDSIARGIQAQAAQIERAETGPLIDPYNPMAPLYNCDPGESSVTYSPSVGGAPLWKHERATLLLNAREQDYPFVAGTAVIGMNRLLTEEEADYLNERFAS
ncbi:MAG: hypothetical protein EON54_03835 [Alcaligenaceae bacterium]|nr:MAG: hypothetical protein EON54_03835 [Alcaligenaceae bacterium]